MYVRACCIGVVTCAGVCAAQDELDFVIGTDGAGMLAMEGGTAEPMVFNDDFNIWIAEEPGFTNLVMDEPNEGFFTLPGSSFITIEILSTDPGLRVLDPLFDPFSQSVEDATITMLELGSPAFDDHPFWAVQLSEWDGVTTEFDVTVRAVDSGSGLAASAPSSLTLTIPAPASASVLGLGLVGLRRRSRDV